MSYKRWSTVKVIIGTIPLITLVYSNHFKHKDKQIKQILHFQIAKDTSFMVGAFTTKFTLLGLNVLYTFQIENLRICRPIIKVLN